VAVSVGPRRVRQFVRRSALAAAGVVAWVDRVLRTDPAIGTLDYELTAAAVVHDLPRPVDGLLLGTRDSARPPSALLHDLPVAVLAPLDVPVVVVAAARLFLLDSCSPGRSRDQARSVLVSRQRQRHASCGSDGGGWLGRRRQLERRRRRASETGSGLGRSSGHVLTVRLTREAEVPRRIRGGDGVRPAATDGHRLRCAGPGRGPPPGPHRSRSRGRTPSRDRSAPARSPGARTG
jgi:hypothetical protein